MPKSQALWHGTTILLILCGFIYFGMSVKRVEIEYEYLNSYKELPENDRVLVEKAIEALGGAYAPYSGFQVGAALRLKGGQILKGANQENAAYPSGLCAERTAMFYANANYPALPIEAIAVVAAVDGRLERGITYPCGACRQVMIEFEKKGGEDIKVILAGSDTVEVFKSVRDILPFSFDSLDPEIEK